MFRRKKLGEEKQANKQAMGEKLKKGFAAYSIMVLALILGGVTVYDVVHF